MLITHWCDKITNNNNLVWYLSNLFPLRKTWVEYNAKLLEGVSYVGQGQGQQVEEVYNPPSRGDVLKWKNINMGCRPSCLSNKESNIYLAKVPPETIENVCHKRHILALWEQINYKESWLPLFFLSELGLVECPQPKVPKTKWIKMSICVCLNNRPVFSMLQI